MAHIEIAFSPGMERAIREGRKCCTTRRREVGEVGDTFLVGGRVYRFVDIHSKRLHTVSTLYFRQEGCSSEKGFEHLWKSLHQGSFEAHETCYVHWFARVETDENECRGGDV